MLSILNPYSSAVWALGTAGLLFVLQLVVADFAGIRAGHIPGVAPQSGHKDFVFRAARAHANTNESIAAFIALLLFAMFAGGDASWVNALAWGWVASRLAHMLCYYADLRIMRSTVFAISLLLLVLLFVTGVRA